MQDHKIEISQRTIIVTLMTLLGVWLLYQVRGIVILLFVSFLLMTAVNPLLKWAAKIRFPTLLVMMFIYFGLIALISGIVASLAPAVVQQTKALTMQLPDILRNMEKYFNVQLDSNVIAGYFNTIPGSLVHIVAGAFGNILSVLAVFFMTYYLVLERPFLHKYLASILPRKRSEAETEKIVTNVEKAVGSWVRGELTLMVIVGTMMYIGLTLLRIPYALPLAILAGMLEAVPSIGPIISAIPCVLIGLSVSPLIGLGALILSILVQQLENNLIVPRVMQSATGLRPLVTLVVLLTGYTLGGVEGAVLSIPLFLTGRTIYNDLKN
jgi:predicted PurR-regulated permease PerM